MFDILVLVAFVWLFVRVIKLAFRAAWGLAKVVAVILMILALPFLIVCLVFFGGWVLLIPLALLSTAFGILKACL